LAWKIAGAAWVAAEKSVTGIIMQARDLLT
jgi:hypothetical protein